MADSCKQMVRSLATLLLAELGDSDAIHVHDTLSGEALAHGDAAALLRLVLGLTDDAGLGELLEAVADVLASGLPGVLTIDTSTSLSTVVLAEALDANLLPHVKLVADGGGARVEPVIVERAKLTEAGSLNGLGPLLNIIILITESRLDWDKKRRDKIREDTRISASRHPETYVGDLELASLLQVLGECFDEFARRYVFHSVYVFVQQRKVLLHE